MTNFYNIKHSQPLKYNKVISGNDLIIYIYIQLRIYTNTLGSPYYLVALNQAMKMPICSGLQFC